jgi:hypothetical protein
MLLQGTATVIEVVDFDFYAFFVAKRDEFLLDSIPRETIAYTEDADE